MQGIIVRVEASAEEAAVMAAAEKRSLSAQLTEMTANNAELTEKLAQVRREPLSPPSSLTALLTLFHTPP